MTLLFRILSVFRMLLIFGGAVYAQVSPPLSGAWSGSLNAGGTTLHLVCHFTSMLDKTLSGTFDSLDQGAMGLPFSAVRVTGQSVHLEASSVGKDHYGPLDAGRGQSAADADPNRPCPQLRPPADAQSAVSVPFH
jgi:hypothetical protein